MARKTTYQPSPSLLAHLPEISGNRVNGLNEVEVRPPSQFFWHPPDQHPFGELQKFVVKEFRPAAGEDKSFRNPDVDRGPDMIAINKRKVSEKSGQFTKLVKAFALDNEADLVGITPMQPTYIFDGYEINDPTVIVLGFQHDYDSLSRAPGSKEDPSAYRDLHDQYNRGARAANKLTNFIREQGYHATSYPGPMADALSMLPAAIKAGLGELGKHGSLINRKFGSGFRLSAVTTDLPLNYDQADVFGGDEFCVNCQVCINACPPDAIHNEKQLVRGEHKWYVDFDKCIPYFGENYACGICIAVCPWTRPGIAENILVKMARRKDRLQGGTPPDTD